MNFAQAIDNQTTTTTNGMKAFVSTGDACTSLFFSIGASRGKDIIPQFTAAMVEDKDVALRIAAWSRDVRGGAGERDIFRNILTHLETNDPDSAVRLVNRTLDLGRADDLLVFKTPKMKSLAFTMLGDELRKQNGLVAKWMPREKGANAALAFEIMKFFGMTPKSYRKALTGMSNTVEQKMCAKEWDTINFSHVPSLAHARYKKAFGRQTTKYAEYVTALVKGDPSVKINAGAIFPHDVLKGRISPYNMKWDKTDLDVITAQWNALPNYIGNAKVLPLVDVSGSMTTTAGKGPTTCLEVAVSLGLYFADKNTGAFKDCMLTFSSSPELVKLSGDINQKINQMVSTDWEMGTNLEAALQKVLTTATENSVASVDMPETLVIFSDMQFNACVNDASADAFSMIKQQYATAGYKMPSVVFWNLNDHGNVPVKFDTSGTALVSGFSPAIASSVLSADMEGLTPKSIMLKAVMQPRYDL